MAETRAVEADRLTVSRGGVEVLHDLSFTIAAGRVTGLLGPSGCGKTTLMRALVGVQRNVSGTLSVLGTEAGRPPLRRRVAYLTQAPSVYGDLTVRSWNSVRTRRSSAIAPNTQSRDWPRLPTSLSTRIFVIRMAS